MLHCDNEHPFRVTNELREACRDTMDQVMRSVMARCKKSEKKYWQWGVASVDGGDIYNGISYSYGEEAFVPENAYVLAVHYITVSA